MFRNNFPITLLKSLSGGIADKLIYQGISNAYDKKKILEHLDSEKKKKIYQMEVELLKNSSFEVNFTRNKIVPSELIVIILEDIFRSWLNKLNKLLPKRELVFINVDTVVINNEPFPFLQLGFVKNKESNDIDIFNIDFRLLIPFFERRELEKQGFDFSKENFIFSLIEFDKLKEAVIKSVIQELALRSVIEPYKSLYETLNLFHFTDYIESLKNRKLYEELTESYRDFIISNEVYNLKHLTFTKLLEIFNYKDPFFIKTYNYVNPNTKISIDDLKPEFEEFNFTLNDLKIRNNRIITVGHQWYSNQNIQDISIKLTIYFLILQFLIKGKIPREVLKNETFFKR